MTIYDGRESFYQWDLNQKITSNTFAVGDKIHFFNMRQSNALVVKAYELDGKVVADVPNILLQNALALKVWRYEYGENSAQTIEEQVFNVEQRAQPYDYFYTETELYELRKDVARAVEDADTAEQDRELAESGRKTAELDRETNETARATAENERVTAETARANAETLRANAESNRATAETNRVSAEQSRVVAEATRQSAELERQSAETLRQTTFEQSYNNVSNALKGSASGEVIRADDVSPIEHFAKVNIHGKNLIDDVTCVITTRSLNGVTITNNGNGSYTLSGENTSGRFITFTSLEKPAKKCATLPAGTYTTSPGCTAVIIGANTGNLFNRERTFVMTEPFRVVKWYCYVEPNGSVGSGAWSGMPFTFYPQLEKGDTATTYEPYADPETLTLIVQGKNLIPFPYINGDVGDTHTDGGITYKVNADKSITLNGTATTNSYFRLCNVNFGEKYGYENLSNGKISCLDCQYDNGNSFTFIMIKKGETITNKVYYPQVEQGTKVTAWESPKERMTYTPSADGTVDIASLSPTMTLLTDTEGVTIEAEYNRDANLVVADLQSQIDSLKALIEGLQG